jgi:hypothetical protein
MIMIPLNDIIEDEKDDSYPKILTLDELFQLDEQLQTETDIDEEDEVINSDSEDQCDCYVCRQDRGED